MRRTRNSGQTWRWLLLANLAAACYSVGTVWLAQLNWQLWQYVGSAEFEAYHQAWWHGIWWAIFPVAGLAFLGTCAQVGWRPPVCPALGSVAGPGRAGGHLRRHRVLVGAGAGAVAQGEAGRRQP